MTFRDGLRSAVLGLAAVVGLVALMGFTRPTTRSEAPPTDTPPPTQASSAPIAALVDDSGALVLTAGSGGTTVLHALHRSGEKGWQLVLPHGALPLGCAGCPDGLVSTRSASLARATDGKLVPVDVQEPLDDAIGLPGIAAVQQNTALATSPDDTTVRLRLLGAPFSAGTPGPGPAVTLPLDRFQQAHAVIGVAANGSAAAAFATVGVLRPGEWRLLVARGDQVVLDRSVTGYVTQLEGTPDGAACVSPDGARVAFALPAADGVEVTYGPPDRLRTARLRTPGQVQACDVGDAVVTVAQFDDTHPVRLTAIDAAGTTTTRPLDDAGVHAVQFCPGTGTAVLQGDEGTVVSRPAGPPRTIKATTLSGCTTTGTPWFVGNRQVSWLRTR